MSFASVRREINREKSKEQAMSDSHRYHSPLERSPARSKALEKKKESSKSFYKRINTLPYEDRNVEFHKREHGAKFDMEKYKKSAKEQEGAIKESKARFS